MNGLAISAPDFGSRLSGSSPAGGEITSEPKRRFIAQSFSCSPFHCHDTEWMKYSWKGRWTATHPSIHPSIEPYYTDDLSVYSVDKYSSTRWQWNTAKVTSAARLLVLRVGYGIWLYRFLFIAYHFTLSHCHGNDNGLTMPENIWPTTCPVDNESGKISWLDS